MLGAAEFMGGRFGLTSDESTRRTLGQSRSLIGNQ